ncbi:cytochrome P450 [Thiocystis minor]|uniref:cytochrome P450 n=1 Tax=Thiocystis minor TaxID=61597 RepID=UPI001913F795|nr:cytochrome P450 [Thiocystis minor]
MSHPCPAMPARPLAPWQWLTAARDNSLSIWHQGAFTELLMHRRLPGRDLWVLNNPGDVRQVLVREAEYYIKSAETWRPLRPLLGRSLFISEDEDWRLRRRAIAPLLTGHERLHAYEGLMIEAVDEMLSRWEMLEQGAELEMSWECTRLAAEVVSRALFSFRLEGHARTVYEALNRYQDTLGRLDLMSLLGLPSWLPRPGEREARRAVVRLEGVVETILEAVRRRGGGDHRDLPGLLMRADTKGHETLNSTQVRDEFMLALLAGHETTANALCWAYYLLSQDERVRSALETEVDRELAGATPTPGDLARLPYVSAVVSEVLRLYPPIYQFTRQARGESRLGQRTLATGSLLVISPWLLHRHHRFWKQPHAFQPERFLDAGGRRRNQCYIPFGAGPRVCPGAGFAMQELVCAVAMSAQRFRLDLRPGAVVEPLGRLTLRPRYGLPMLLSRR